MIPAKRTSGVRRRKLKSKQERARNAKAIYSKFEEKDMTEAEFIRQYLDLTDPKKAMDDLDDETLRRGRERLNKMKVDKAVGKRF